MTVNFDSADIDLTCPGCGRKFKQKLGRLKQNPTINCPGCQQPIKINAGKLNAGLSKAQNTLGAFQRKLSRIGKR